MDLHQQAEQGWLSGTTMTTGARGSRSAITPLRLPASKRWTDFGEVDRVSLRQFYGWSADRRAKLCVSTFPCVHGHGAPTGAAAAFMIRPSTALSASTLRPFVSVARRRC